MTAILDATVRIFEQENSDAATTTRIAEVAGVSVGTLYQYFSNRDAILEALQDREFERATEFMKHVLTTNVFESDRQVARAVVEGLLSLYAKAPALHRVLVVEGLRITPTDRVQAFDMRMVQSIRSFLVATSVELRRENLDAAAFVIYHSVRATMLARLLEAPPGLDDATLVSELADLMLRYLVADGGDEASEPKPSHAAAGVSRTTLRKAQQHSSRWRARARSGDSQSM